jgi:hypothetical protein
MVKLNSEPHAIVRLHDLDPAEAARLTAGALAGKGMNRGELARQLHYCSLERSLEKVEKVLAGTITLEEIHILRRIGEILGIDQERLCGEQWFFDADDYQRYLFRPYLMRVAEHTRPTQVTMAALYGLKRCFLVASYPELLSATREEQLEVVKLDVIWDMRKLPITPFFGKTVGYAFFYEYRKALPLSVEGEDLAGVEVAISTCCSEVSLGEAKAAGRVVHVPRFVSRGAA